MIFPSTPFFLIILTLLSCSTFISAAIIVHDSSALRQHATLRQEDKFRSRCLLQERLSCVLRPTTNNTVEGVVEFFTVFVPKSNETSRRCFVRVKATVTNLTPGPHGFHIHTFGDLRGEDGASTGGHFIDPWKNSDRKHGMPWSRPRHWGDFGNLMASEDGIANYEETDRLIFLRFVLGRGMIVHAGRDKGSSFQSSGDAGARQACCVIGYENPEF